MVPLGMVHPHMQPLAPVFALGQMLHQQAASDAALAVAAHRHPDQRRHLLGLGKIALARLGQRGAFKRDNPLIALLGAGHIKRDRQIALAKQRIERGIDAQLRQPLGIMPDIAAQLTSAVIADQQVNDPAFGLRLHGQLPIAVLEQRADQRGDRQSLGQQVRNRGGIGVRRQHRIEHWPQPHHPPARIARRNADAHHLVVTGFTLGNMLGCAHNWPKTQRSTLFCAWSRFSASSHTAERAPSITASVTSSPRCAGRQCRNSASLAAPAISAGLT